MGMADRTNRRRWSERQISAARAEHDRQLLISDKNGDQQQSEYKGLLAMLFLMLQPGYPSNPVSTLIEQQARLALNHLGGLAAEW